MTRLLSVAVGLMLVFPACSLGTEVDREVEIHIEHSRFSPDVFRFDSGTTVRFVIHNGDPIDHEFILGDESVQSVHENGTHSEHGQVPGEVSVPAGETASTIYEFTRPGELIIGCHLPAHYDYGMRADVKVLP